MIESIENQEYRIICNIVNGLSYWKVDSNGRHALAETIQMLYFAKD